MPGLKPTLLCLLFALLAACTALQADLPAITETPTGDHQQGRVVWHDLLTNDPEGSRRFYGGLFGWEFETSGNDAYQLIRHNGELIGGSEGVAQAVRNSASISCGP